MNNQPLIPGEIIVNKIYLIRGEKVMLDADLASLYGIAVKRLKEAVKRNVKRFPPDFLFVLSGEETINLRSQIASSSWGGARYLPYAFTEQGVAMLSGILNSDRAISVNIAIMRAFVQFRRALETNSALAKKIGELELAVAGHDEKITLIFQAIKQMIEKKIEPPSPRTTIGYRIKKEEK
jgi:membrane-associated protease RseP (regulator of RpoE activity)